jgi:hypothetical protein
MNAPLTALRYTLQARAERPEGAQTHLLLSLDASRGARAPGLARWVVATSGAVSEATRAALQDAWDLASIDGASRELQLLEQPAGVRALADLAAPQAALSAQLRAVSAELSPNDELETTMELSVDVEQALSVAREPEGSPRAPADLAPRHLLILLAEGGTYTTPQDKDLSPFESVTVVVERCAPSLWSWVRWAARLGARVLFAGEALIAELSAAIQDAASRPARAPLALRPSMEGKLLSVVSLSAPLAPLTVDGIASFYQPCLREEERAAWLVTLQESPTPALERELLICDHLGARHTLKAGATGSNGLEVAQPAVAFAQQLAQRARCFDQVMSAYARNDLRKVVQGLDQWMKVTTALEGEEAGREVHLLKVKFLHLGRFDTLDVVRFVRQGFWSPYLLTSSGEWVASSPLPPLI